MIKIKETNDELYPMYIGDNWCGGVYVHFWTITDDKKWNAFIADLNKVREEILKKSLDKQ